MGWEKQVTSFGVILILVGIGLLLIPVISKLFSPAELEKIPWLLLYVYRKDGFFFATSPLLILLGVVYTLWTFIQR